MQTLIEENGYITYLIEFKETDLTHFADFTVYKVNCWDGNTNEPIDPEQYLEGLIKWDGCAHFNFGNDGYIHFCGEKEFEQHKQVIDKVWDICSKKISSFNG